MDSHACDWVSAMVHPRNLADLGSRHRLPCPTSVGRTFYDGGKHQAIEPGRSDRLCFSDRDRRSHLSCRGSFS
mgnify:FL=1